MPVRGQLSKPMSTFRLSKCKNPTAMDSSNFDRGSSSLSLLQNKLRMEKEKNDEEDELEFLEWAARTTNYLFF